MKITLNAVGRMKKGPLLDLIQEYSKRLSWTLSITEIEAKLGLSGDVLKQAEGEVLLKAVPDGEYVIALDERGQELSSQGFSNLLEDIQHHHGGTVHFIIGGADGLSDQVRERAQRLVSFGKTTWPHMMVRVMLLEQLYRAQQIQKGHPYHRG